MKHFDNYVNVISLIPCNCIKVKYLIVENLAGGKFHNRLRDVFAPQVVRYVDLMESSIAQSIHKGFEKENWKPQG